MFLYIFSIWGDGGSRTSILTSLTWLASAGARCTASTTSPRPSWGTPSTRPSCRCSRILERNQLLVFSGGRLRSESGEISLEDISDANLLHYTPASGAPRGLWAPVFVIIDVAATFYVACVWKRWHQIWPPGYIVTSLPMDDNIWYTWHFYGDTCNVLHKKYI